MVYTKENYNINTLKWTKDEKPCVVCGKNTHALDYYLNPIFVPLNV